MCWGITSARKRIPSRGQGQPQVLGMWFMHILIGYIFTKGIYGSCIFGYVFRTLNGKYKIPFDFPGLEHMLLITGF